jgi:hypothetical protein
MSEAFPAGTIPNVTGDLRVTWDEIVWAALTIGRPSTHHVLTHGPSSGYEAMFRISLIRMALEQFGPSATRLRRTEAFKNLDPTEKGAVSYFLGMAFCKVFASRLLNTPWLLHLDVYKTAFLAMSLGRSRPDLFGLQIGTGAWLAFESKGRATKPSTVDRAKAKVQALRLLSVGGTPCSLHIGAFTYFTGDVLNFHWVDPDPETKRPINLPDIGDGWRYYYEPIRSLWAGELSTHESDATELSVTLPQLDVKILIHRLLAPTFLMRVWDTAQRQMLRHHETLVADGFQPDGIKVECGPSWSQRRLKPQETS